MYFYPYDYTTHGMGDDQSWNDDLERRFPPIYGRIYPWVNYFCCDMELKHGDDYEPSREDIKDIVEKIYDKIKDDLDDDDDHDHKHRDDTRVPLYYGGRGYLNDLIGVVLLGELIGRRDHRRRRPRRRRRRPHYGYPYGY